MDLWGKKQLNAPTDITGLPETPASDEDSEQTCTKKGHWILK